MRPGTSKGAERPLTPFRIGRGRSRGSCLSSGPRRRTNQAGDVCEPGLRVDFVEPGCLDQGVDGGAPRSIRVTPCGIAAACCFVADPTRSDSRSRPTVATARSRPFMRKRTDASRFARIPFDQHLVPLLGMADIANTGIEMLGPKEWHHIEVAPCPQQVGGRRLPPALSRGGFAFNEIVELVTRGQKART
jgi:hypothetical protein